jgi:hypothetical protein
MFPLRFIFVPLVDTNYTGTRDEQQLSSQGDMDREAPMLSRN